MSQIKYAENYYAFRNLGRVYDTVVQPPSGAESALAAIEATLTEANNHFLARRYQAAITAYRAAERLIYAHLNPSAPQGGSGPVFKVPRDARLFESLLSASAEWLNVVTVRQPPVVVTPRVPVDPELLGDATAFDAGGVVSTGLRSAAAVSAAADMQVSRALEVQNPTAARFFSDRALRSDATVAAALRGAAAARELRTNALDPALLQVAEGDDRTLTRAGARLGRRAAQSVGVALPTALTEGRTLGRVVNGEMQTFSWGADQAPPVEAIRSTVYKARIDAIRLSDVIMQPSQVSDIAVNLPHDYYYVIPLGLAECYHMLGEFESAEQSYFQAAAYQYLNAAIEAPYVWLRLATLYLDWGNSLFSQDATADARDIYERVLTIDDAEPGSTLYTTAALKPGADVGRAVIASLATAADLEVNPNIVAVILEVRQQLIKIKGGLDFWGHWHASVPIWTFDYLQSVAINFAQMAIGAERDFIEFRDRADQAAFTRRQLETAKAQADAEVNAAQMQAKAAALEEKAYDVAVSLADLREQNAKNAADEYEAMSADAIVRQAVAAQLAGGDNGDPNDLNGRADTLMGIGPVAQYMREHPGNWKMEGSAATLGAAEQLVASRLQRQYEVDGLRRVVGEMALAADQADLEHKAAFARMKAAEAGVDLAKVRQKAARGDLLAFDSQYFTPDVWGRMADAMWRLYQRYLVMALRSSRLMQQAYNFENDEALHLIRTSYATDEVKGLLGAEALMADIQSFTFDRLTNDKSKPQPIRQTISLAERYGYLFETALRKTGVMEFETRIDDFDQYYPGTYAGRIEAIEVEVVGIVPPQGVSGALTNSGISAYRTPAAAWTDPAAPGLKYRIQSKETLILSDYLLRQDGPVVRSDERMMRVFQGAGLASSWKLELPRGINDIDFGALTDVRLTFYYKARFDPELRERVLEQLASRPGINARQRGIPIRWLYPDAFFRFQDGGELAIALKASDFRRNEQAPTLTDLAILIVTDGTVAPGGLKMTFTAPGHAAVAATTDATGSISSSAAGSPLSVFAGKPAIGEYRLKLTAADNPGLVADGRLRVSPISNVALVVGYEFTPRA